MMWCILYGFVILFTSFVYKRISVVIQFSAKYIKVIELRAPQKSAVNLKANVGFSAVNLSYSCGC